MKKIVWLIALLALLLIAGSEPVDPIRLTIINKSEEDIAIQLTSKNRECCTSKEIDYGEFYYLPVLEGSRETPTTKTFIIEREQYLMQLFYLETWDPVYGFECGSTAPNTLIAQNNLRVVVLPCGEFPGPRAVGERTMWKYIPFPVPQLAVIFNNYWATRLIY